MSKTLTLDSDDIVIIEKHIEQGHAKNASEFIQKAVKMYLKSMRSEKQD